MQCPRYVSNRHGLTSSQGLANLELGHQRLSTNWHLQGRLWQSPQTVKTPDHSAVARLKHELQDERRKLQVLTYLLQPPAHAASFLHFSKIAAHETMGFHDRP